MTLAAHVLTNTFATIGVFATGLLAGTVAFMAAHNLNFYELLDAAFGYCI